MKTRTLDGTKANKPVVIDTLKTSAERLDEQCGAEVILAAKRLASRLGQSEATRRYHVRHSALLRAREPFVPVDLEYQRLQVLIEKSAVEKDAFDSVRDPARFLEDVVDELSNAPHSPSEPRECWDLVLAFLLLVQPDISMMQLGGPLEKWEGVSSEEEFSRREVSERKHTDSLQWGSFRARVSRAVESLGNRSQCQAFKDTFPEFGNLHGLRYCLEVLHSVLLDPTVEMDDASWQYLLAEAQERARTMPNHWPAGACNSLEINGRISVETRLNMALVKLERGRSVECAPDLLAGMDMLDAYIRPVLKWQTLPICLPKRQGNPGEKPNGSPVDVPPPASPPPIWRYGRWFRLAVEHYSGKTETISVKELGRPGWKPHEIKREKSGGHAMFDVNAVCNDVRFEKYARYLRKAVDEKYVPDKLRRPPKSGRTGAATPRGKKTAGS